MRKSRIKCLVQESNFFILFKQTGETLHLGEEMQMECGENGHEIDFFLLQGP